MARVRVVGGAKGERIERVSGPSGAVEFEGGGLVRRGRQMAVCVASGELRETPLAPLYSTAPSPHPPLTLFHYPHTPLCLTPILARHALSTSPSPHCHYTLSPPLLSPSSHLRLSHSPSSTHFSMPASALKSDYRSPPPYSPLSTVLAKRLPASSLPSPSLASSSVLHTASSHSTPLTLTSRTSLLLVHS